MLPNNNSKIAIVSNHRRYNFSRKELSETCVFFNTYFSSSFCSATSDNMQLSAATSQLVDIKYLHLIIKLLRHNTPRHRIRLLRHNHRDSNGSSKKLRAWTLQASDRQLGEMLRVCDYFQLTDLAAHYFGATETPGTHRRNIDDTDVKIAVKLLPFADTCGGADRRLFEIALRIASTAFTRARRLLPNDDVVLTRLLRERARRTRVCGIFRVDTALDDDRGADCWKFSNFYVIVAFSPDDGDNQNDGEWRPRIVDQFRLDNNERVTKAMTLYGYIYVVTTQLIKTNNGGKRCTRIRLRQFNPYDVIANNVTPTATTKPRRWRSLFDSGKKAELGRGWVKLPCKLVKPGVVDHVQVDIHDDDVIRGDNDVICLRYWSRPATRIRSSIGNRRWLVGSPRPLRDDADRFDMLTEKWSACRTCLQQQHDEPTKFKGPDTMSQILNLNEKGEVQTSVRKSYKQYATEQQYVRSTDNDDDYMLKSLTVIHPSLPTNNNDDVDDGDDVHIGVFYRILVDRSNIKGSSRFQLTQYKLGGQTSQHRVLYTLSNHHPQLRIKNDVEDLLRHSNLAVPEILNLSAYNEPHL